MKLKTLKDFMPFEPKETGSLTDLVDGKKLKQEAIKRVKSCGSPVDFSRNDRCGKSLDKFPHNHCEVCQREIWFNNITEEDLK